MNPLVKNLIGLGIFLIAVISTLGFLFSKLSERSFYKTSGSVSLSALNDSVRIYTDEFGVPSIEAKNESDMYFALGYKHAQDRLWQMDLARRVGEGRLSEIFGRETLEFDKLFRTIGIYKIAYLLYHQISPKSKEILISYSDGVNSFIRTHIKNLPFEFDVLDYKPDPWKPEHSLMIIRLMAWDLNFAWYSDYILAELVNRFGPDLAKDFFPDYPSTGPFTIKSKDDSVIPKDTVVNLFDTVVSRIINREPDQMKNFANILINYKNFFGSTTTGQGSNAWVVASSKADNGKPILANDIHLSLSVPSQWYEVQLVNSSAGQFTAGFSLPGTPGIVAGRNGSISWGVTNLMNDDTDFLLLKRVSAGSNVYLYKDNSYTLDSTVEEIKIKDEVDGHFFTTYSTKIGPVVSGLEKSGFSNYRKLPENENELLVLNWTGYSMSDEVLAFYNVNNSANWKEFRNSLKDLNAPALNFLYADTSGNIGYQVAGFIPKRSDISSAYDAYYPSKSSVEWQGFIAYDKLPTALNPDSNFFVSANNPPVKNPGFYISYLFEPPYRAARIEEVMSSRSLFSAEEFQLIQTDVNSLQAKQMLSYLFKAFEDTTGIEINYVPYLKLLKGWDYQMLSSSPEATIFSMFELKLYENIYHVRFGDELFRDYLFVKSIPIRNTVKLLRSEKSWLFNINPVSVEPVTPDRILKLSFYQAIDKLTEISGTSNYDNWRWSDFHQVLMQHPLGSVPAVSNVLNIGPFGIGGNGTTVSNCGYNFYKTFTGNRFESTVGASIRMIVDLSNDTAMTTVNSTGQSGQPLHKNYNDQSRLWLFGEYKTFDLNAYQDKAASMNFQMLIPSD